MTTIYGWSGTRQRLSLLASRHLTYLLSHSQFQRAGGFVTGACVGVDSFVGSRLADLYPDARHMVVVPANRSRISRWWGSYKNVEVFEMLAHSSYRERNVRIVAFSDRLMAIPEAEENASISQRSGTWQTVRIAHGHHDQKPVFLTLNDLEKGIVKPRLYR